MKHSTAIMAASALSTVAAYGSMAVVNRCSYDIYLWHVPGNGQTSEMFTLPKNTPTVGYKENYRFTSATTGVSLKIAPYYLPGGQVPASKITQLEYTVPLQDGHGWSEVLYYDLSWVNGDAFVGVSMTMETNGNCPSGSCGGLNLTTGEPEPCDVGYQWSTDDTKTHSCGLENDIIWTFCNGNPQVGLPSNAPLGETTMADPWFSTDVGAAANSKRDAEADSNAMAVCGSTGAMGEIVGLCDEPEPAPTTSSTSTTPSPTPTPTPSSSSAPAPSPVAALAVSKSSSSSAPAAAASSPAPAVQQTQQQTSPASAALGMVKNYIGSMITTPLSNLQLTNVASTGVNCWLSIDNGGVQDCTGGGNMKRELQKREPHAHAHAHAHNHMDYHRRQRIQKRH